MTTEGVARVETVMRAVSDWNRDCEEPTGRANARPMTGSATKQSILPLRGEMDCFASLAMTVSVALLLAMTRPQIHM
jgi:hypothetical protein